MMENSEDLVNIFVKIFKRMLTDLIFIIIGLYEK